MDPGTSSFAVAVVKTKLVEGKLRFKVEGTSMLDPQRLVNDMRDLRTQAQTFLEYVKPMMESGPVDAFIIERFQARGGKGPTIESISSMIAALAITYPDIPVVTFITAGVWKNAYNLFGDLKELYEDHKELRRDKTIPHIEIHQLDACLMALYQASKHYDVKPFDYLTSLEIELKMLRVLDSSKPITVLPERLPKIKKVKKKAKRKAK